MPEESSLKKPLVIIGDEDAVSGFKALGFKVYATREPQEFRAALDETVAEGAAVCLVQDNIYQALGEEINNYKNLPFPVFIPFAKNGDMALLETMVRDIRLRATGKN